jgi:hypothetical protein
MSQLDPYGKEPLTLAKCHDHRSKVLAMEGKNLLEFRNIFHNFRSSTKFYKNPYWIKLDLAHLKLKDIPDAIYIHFIFLEPRTDEDLSKEIYFIFFWFQIKLVQIFEPAMIWIYS